MWDRSGVGPMGPIKPLGPGSPGGPKTPLSPGGPSGPGSPKIIQTDVSELKSDHKRTSDTEYMMNFKCLSAMWRQSTTLVQTDIS